MQHGQGTPARRPRVTAAGAAALGLLLTAGPALATRCLQSEIDALRPLIRTVSPNEMHRNHGPDDPMTPPTDPQVGDSWLWYTWSLAGPPTAQLKMCTVRGEGQHVYVVVEDSQWLTRVDQADIDRIVQSWDAESVGPWPNLGIYDLDTQNFGPCPDELDNDPKPYVLYYDFDVSSDGFFWYFDEFPDGTQPYASNECEVLYMNCSDFDPGGDYLVSVQAHEFQHMIHWGADRNEDSWVNEGCSELAMWLFGHPDVLSGFPSNPDNNLTTWNGNFADYVKTYLWTLYLYEHFGGQASILNLVSQAANSSAGVQAMLTAMGYSETFPQVVRDWTVANWLDDPTLAGGKYNYANEDLPTFNSTTRSTYPIPNTNGSVNHYAADYVKLINGVPQRVFFDGSDTSDWAIQAVTSLAGAPLDVISFSLDAADAGFIDLPEFGTGYDQVVLVLTNVSSAGVTTYQYSSTAEPTAVPNAPLAGGLELALAGANPFSEEARVVFAGGAAAPLHAGVYSANGRHVRDLAVRSSTSEIVWDGRDASGAMAPSGVYFLRASGGGETGTLRVVLQR